MRAAPTNATVLAQMPAREFLRVFPFYFAWNDDGVILETGPSLRKVCPDATPGRHLTDVFRLVRPQGDLSRAFFREKADQLFILEDKITKRLLRGGYLALPDSDIGVMLGAPWITHSDQLASFGLTNDDFAVHDQTLEMLLLVQTQQTAANDLRQLNAQLLEKRAQLLEQEARLRKLALVASSTDNAVVLADSNMHIEWVNDAFSHMTGWPAQEVHHKPLWDFLAQTAAEDIPLQRVMDSLKAGDVFRTELSQRRRDGMPYWLSIEAQQIDEASDVETVMIIGRDVTERKRAEDALRHSETEARIQRDEAHRLAAFDSLTQLPNRRILQERLARELPIAARSGLRGALLFLDLDNFKSLNDTRGHAVGDRLLIEAGQRLLNAVRKGDIVARMGGDEFVVLLTGLSRNSERAAYQANTIGEKILKALAKHYQFIDFEFSCTASMGATLFAGNETVDELLQQADIAMYQAKKSGRSRLRFFDEEMQAAARSHTFLEQQLSRITLSDELELYYQPQIDAAGQIEAAEGLLRWNHPELGIIAPADFIPVAEESGLILTIGRWVLEAACAQLKAWENNSFKHKIRLSVNVSARQFAQPNFEETVRKVINDAKIDPQMLMLELTESMMQNAVDTAAKMNRLKEIGVTFSLDDFGTGYSSLSVLTQLPLAQLKIAQTLVSDLTIKKAATSVIETIIGMGRSLDLSVVAEGVQTEAQWAFLQSNGCTHFQGYLFSSPLPIKAFDDFIFTNKGTILKMNMERDQVTSNTPMPSIPPSPERPAT